MSQMTLSLVCACEIEMDVTFECIMSHMNKACHIQPVPAKMRLEMAIGMRIGILNGHRRFQMAHFKKKNHP